MLKHIAPCMQYESLNLMVFTPPPYTLSHNPPKALPFPLCCFSLVCLQSLASDPLGVERLLSRTKRYGQSPSRLPHIQRPGLCS